MVSDFELKVLRRIARNGMISGNKMVAVTAAARRLERKGYAHKSLHWHITDKGRSYIAEIDKAQVDTR